jgi:hypothetical protein
LNEFSSKDVRLKACKIDLTALNGTKKSRYAVARQQLDDLFGNLLFTEDLAFAGSAS